MTMAMARILLVCLATAVWPCESRDNSQDYLMKDLLDDYGYTTRRPVYNTSHPTPVEFQLLLTNVVEVSERDQTIEIGAWLLQEWVDEFLTWDPSEHDGIEHLFVHKSKVWIPDFTLYKSVDRGFETYKDIPVFVRSNGKVSWNTLAILKCTCLMDTRLFPFDTQVCPLTFVSWAYDITELNLTQYRETYEQIYYTDVGVWELLNITTMRIEQGYYSNYKEGLTIYPELTYFIHVRRRHLIHTLQIVLPSLMLSLLNLMVFVLPPESGEKISLGVTNLLALILFQQLTGDSLPPTTKNAPIIGYYIFSMIILACTSLVFTVVVLNVFYCDNGRPIPRWVRLIVFGFLARLVCQRARYVGAPSITVKSRQDNCGFLAIGRESGSMETACTLTDTSGFTTRNAGEASSSILFNNRGGDCDGKGRYRKTLKINQRPRAVASSKSLDSPIMRTRRRVHGEIESRQDETRESSRPTDDWKDIAVVIDRTALIFASIITLSSVVGTSVAFIVQLNTTEN